jgi:hypothetical protein
MDVRQRTEGSAVSRWAASTRASKDAGGGGLVGLLHSARTEPPPPVKRTGGAGLGLLPRSAPGRLA